MTLVEFRARYTQFATISDALVETYFTEAALFVGALWEDLADMGTGLYVAHMCALETAERAAGTGAAQGEYISRSVGSLSMTRSSSVVDKSIDDHFFKTAYGQRFAALRKLVGKGAVASGSLVDDSAGLGLCEADTIVPTSG